MRRQTSLLLVLLLCFYTSISPALAAAADYESIVNQLVYATTGQLPSAPVLTNLESALAAANAPTNLAGLAAAYSTNAAVKSIIDSLSSNLSTATYGSNTESFVTSVYQNAFGHPPQVAGLTFWSNAINSGAVSRGDAALSILAGASVADMSTFTNTIVTAKATFAADIAAKEAADKAAKEAADKAAKEAADKAAKEAADKAAKEAEEATKQSKSSGEGIVDKVKTFVHNHPVATAVIATVVVAGIVTAITVPICVHQSNLNRVHNQQRTLNNQAITTRLIQLSRPTSTVTTGGATGGGGYQPQI